MGIKTLYFHSPCLPSTYPCIAPAWQNRTHYINHVQVFFFYYFPSAPVSQLFLSPTPPYPLDNMATHALHPSKWWLRTQICGPTRAWPNSGFDVDVSFADQLSALRKINDWKAKTSITQCSPESAEFREVFKDNSIHKMKVIFWALISSSALISKYHLAHSVLSALFISKKLILLFFPGQIGVLYSSRLPGVLRIFGMWKIWSHG